MGDDRELARLRLSRQVFDCLDDGASAKATLAANRDDLHVVAFRQPVPRDVSSRSLSTRVLGTAPALPIVLARVGFGGMIVLPGHRDGPTDSRLFMKLHACRSSPRQNRSLQGPIRKIVRALLLTSRSTMIPRFGATLHQFSRRRLLTLTAELRNPSPHDPRLVQSTCSLLTLS